MLRKTGTETWRKKASNAAVAFKAAGLWKSVPTHVWVNAVRNSIANYAGRNAQNKEAGMHGRGSRQPMPGAYNYIPRGRNTNGTLAAALKKIHL